MQRDTDFTFEDIFGSPYAVGSQIHDNYITSIISEKQLADTCANLRFVRIPDTEADFDISSGITCILSEKGENRGTLNYLAVSYCWDSYGQSNPNVENASSIPFSAISINERGVIRQPRCPAEVALRAVKFAIRMKISLIWIDQECIDQSDLDDVRKHLQCMHTIFKQAKCAIGLLSFEISTWAQYMAMIRFHLVEKERNLTDTDTEAKMRSIDQISYMTRLLRAISRDRWFTRTWVFQERYSSLHAMYLLLPVAPEIRETLRAGGEKELSSGDFPLHTGGLSSLPMRWTAHLIEKTHTGVMEPLHDALRRLNDVAQFLGSPTFRGVPLEMLTEVIQTGKFPPDKAKPGGGFNLRRIFQDIEQCDNKVVSDRVAIFANLAKLEWRLDAAKLKSYSTSLLSLLYINQSIPSMLIYDVDDRRWRSMFITSVTATSLADIIFDLKDMMKAGKEGLEEEMKRVCEVLARVDASHGTNIARCESRDELLEGLDADGRRRLVEHLNSISVAGVKAVTVIPMSATIPELFEGIVATENDECITSDPTHSERILDYSIRHKQVPEGSSFIAFGRKYRWRDDFVQKYFS
jgi:hypothetical protein